MALVTAHVFDYKAINGYLRVGTVSPNLNLKKNINIFE